MAPGDGSSTGKVVTGIAVAGVALGLGALALTGLAVASLATNEDVGTLLQRLRDKKKTAARDSGELWFSAEIRPFLLHWGELLCPPARPFTT